MKSIVKKYATTVKVDQWIVDKALKEGLHPLEMIVEKEMGACHIDNEGNIYYKERRLEGEALEFHKRFLKEGRKTKLKNDFEFKVIRNQPARLRV